MRFGEDRNQGAEASALERESVPGASDAANTGAFHFQAAAPKGTGRLGRRHDVLFVTEDSALCESLPVYFAEMGQFNLRQFGGRLADVAENLAKIKLPDVLAVDLSEANGSDIEVLDWLKKTAFAKVPIVAISNNHDQHIVRGLMQLKIDDWLPAGCAASDIHASCEQAVILRQAEPGEAETKCTAFLPAHGGCGNTALAIETAFLIGNKKKQLESTCLVDLNFQDGAIADYLDLSPAFQLSELSDISNRLDRQLLEVMLTRHSSGMAVFATPRAPGQYIEIREELIASILGLLSEAFDHLIIDLPRHWWSWTENVIWGSDRIFVVTGFTVPALRNARFLADAVAAKAAAKAEVSVIVNKFHEPLMGAGLTRKDAEGILEARLGGFIPNLGGLVDDAINRGTRLAETRAGNKVGKKLSQILDGDARAAKAGK